MSMLLDAFLDRYLPALEMELRALLTAPEPSYASYYHLLQYHMGWLDRDLKPVPGRSGKRVRPVLCLLACDAAAGTFENALPAAVAIEMLHNFSLLHDDIEDRSNTRRGRPTVWKLWGVARAINAGDGLFAASHIALARLAERAVPPERVFAALRVFGQSCLALTQGQHLDMEFEQRLDVTVAEYLKMVAGKTAALIAASTELGALIAGADDRTLQQYQAFGHHLGLAFQVRDDILGIWGNPDVTGKSTFSDIETCKKTLPIVYGLERSPALRHMFRSNAIPREQVEQVIELLDTAGARATSEEIVSEHFCRAMEAWALSGASGLAGQAMEELTTLLLTREN